MQSADSGAVANGRRIAVNAAVTYARSLIALVLGLFSARWVLAALGAVDFGLYAVVGSMMAFVKVNDETSDFSLLVMPSQYRMYAAVLRKGIYIRFDGKMTDDGKCIVNSLHVIK